MNKRRIKITLQYDGTNYQGWQVQPDGTTIQGLVEEAVSRITGVHVSVTAAGRTDAGVHAIEQVASADIATRLGGETLKMALNSLLPRDVRVLSVTDALPDFHARHSAVRKRYVYFIANGQDVSVFAERYVWHLRQPLDLEAMSSSAQCMVGRHDFAAFRGSGCGARDTVREVYSAGVELIEEPVFFSFVLPGKFVRISVEADGFLRHMVRNIAGTLVEAGRGKTAPAGVAAVLEGRDRRRAGPTAPARGLFLERVYYTASSLLIFSISSLFS